MSWWIVSNIAAGQRLCCSGMGLICRHDVLGFVFGGSLVHLKSESRFGQCGRSAWELLMMSQDNPIKFKCLQPTNKKNVHALLLILCTFFC